jgi:hypothetical protein
LRRTRCGRLGQTEVGALADDLDAQIRAVDADGVIGLVAGVGVALALGLHIGADAAEIEQLGLRLQDRGHQLGRRDGLGLDLEQLAHFLRQRNALQARAKTPPPAEIFDLS